MLEILSAIGMNVLVATLGGFAVIAFTAFKRHFVNWRLQRRFPVGGEYLSTFEDETDGEVHTVKAFAILKQSGLDISGVTFLDGRKWNLDGRITKDGYFLGRYHADNLHDRGFGHFFLELSSNGEMRGVWSGYDSVNRKVVAGKYEFWPVQHSKIVPMEKGDVTSCARIAQRQLGESFLKAEDLLANKGIKLCSKQDGAVLGFCTANVVSRDDFLQRLPVSAHVAQCRVANRIGLIASVATDPAFAGKGIGTRLVEAAVVALQKEQVDLLAMIAWKSRAGVHIGSIAERQGFESSIEIPDCWKESSLKHKYRCPECGDPPCRCSAILYLRPVYQMDNQIAVLGDCGRSRAIPEDR